MEWRSISPELAKQHPLYGVGGWLIFFIVFLGLLILASPIVTILAKEAAGRSFTGFIPNVQWLGYFFVIWAIFKKDKNILRTYIIFLPGLSILGILFLSYYSELGSILLIETEYLPVGIVVRDAPMLLYLIYSRRARVTFQHQVRGDDPILAQDWEQSPPESSMSEPTDVPVSGKGSSRVVPENARGGSTHGVSTAPSRHVQKGPAQTKSVPEPEINSEPKREGQAPEPDTTTAEAMGTKKAMREKYPKAYAVIKYDKTAAEQFNRLNELPEEFAEKFLDAVEEDTRGDTEKLAEKLLEEHRKQIAPYEDDKLNAALGEMRKISPEAEQEFRKAVEVIGEDRIDPDFVCQQIREDMVPRWLKRSQVKSPNASKTAISSRFTETILELSDAIELLEMLGYEIRRGSKRQVLMDGKTIMEGKTIANDLWDFRLIDFANQKLHEYLELEVSGVPPQETITAKNMPPFNSTVTNIGAILFRFPETILKLSDAIELLEMLGYEVSRGGNYYGYNSKSHGYILSLKGEVIRGMLDYQLVEFANQKLTEVILDAGNHP